MAVEDHVPVEAAHPHQEDRWQGSLAESPTPCLHAVVLRRGDRSQGQGRENVAELPLCVIVNTLLRDLLQMAHRWYPRPSGRKVAPAFRDRGPPGKEPPAPRFQRR